MKKSIIAAGASAVLAAMPVVGVFAEDYVGLGPVKDTINLTVTANCAITATEQNKTIAVSMLSGAVEDDIAGSSMSITCNNINGWYLQAVGAGESGHTTEIYSPTLTGNAIATGTSSAANDDSYWAFKLAGTGVYNGTGSGAAAENFANFHAVPSTNTTVAKGASPISNNVIDATYKISLSATQPAGNDYTGAVQYTLTSGAES